MYTNTRCLHKICCHSTYIEPIVIDPFIPFTPTWLDREFDCKAVQPGPSHQLHKLLWVGRRATITQVQFASFNGGEGNLPDIPADKAKMLDRCDP